MIDLYNEALHARDGASGFYNDNIRVETPSGPVIVRIPIAGAHAMDLRIWPEQHVLASLLPYVSRVPKLLHVSAEPAFQIHEFISGHVLDAIAPRGNRVPPIVLHDVIELFAELTEVPLKVLPALPASWPAEGDVPAFARRLSDITQNVYVTFRQRYRTLFKALGIPDEPLSPVLAQWPDLQLRPFVLVHADVHRKNMIYNGQHITFLDWELALWGDPVYELAVHLHKMGYYDDERQNLLDRWAETLSPKYTRHWESDLAIYLAHEQVKSAIVDTVRYKQLIESTGLSESQVHHLIQKLVTKLNAAGRVWHWAKNATFDQVATTILRPQAQRR